MPEFSDADPRESQRYAVAVIGAGPAGIAAATVAAEAGQRVIVVDEAPAPGGQIWRASATFPPPPLARQWLDRLQRSSAEVRTGTTVIDLRRLGDEGFQIHTVGAGRPGLVRAGRIILATGARELFLPFPGWTLPGVIGIGAAQALLKSGMQVRGRRVIMAGSGPLLLPVAAALTEAGARLLNVAEQAPMEMVMRFAAGLWRRPGIALQAARYRWRFRRVPYRLGQWILAAEGSAKVERVVITNGSRRWTCECDLLCTGYGLVPNVELPRMAGCRLQAGNVAVDQRQETSVEGIFAAGEPTGIGGMELALEEGSIAGHAAAGREDDAIPAIERRDRLRTHGLELEQTFQLRPELKHLAGPETIACRCEDVRFNALQPEWSMRQAKLYTRLGMGPCQGRICGAALQHVYGWTPEVPHPPVVPVPISSLL